MSGGDLFAPGTLEEAITGRAARCDIRLDADAANVLAAHARAVLAANERLHLTTIVNPGEFLERHLGEAFEGAAAVPAGLAGTHVDIGTGSGFPAIPLLIARPGLTSFLVEASRKKAEFLRRTVGTCGLGARVTVLGQQVQRAADLPEVGSVAILTIRAVGGWSRLLPKLAALLDADGRALLWAGPEVEGVRRREAWRKLELVETRELPSMDRAALWVFRRSSPAA